MGVCSLSVCKAQLCEQITTSWTINSPFRNIVSIFSIVAVTLAPKNMPLLAVWSACSVRSDLISLLDEVEAGLGIGIVASEAKAVAVDTLQRNTIYGSSIDPSRKVYILSWPK